MKNKPKIGWVGLGVMGSSMAGQFLSHGFPTFVYSRTSSKAKNLCGTERNGQTRQAI